MRSVSAGPAASAEREVDDATLAALQLKFRGPLLRPGDPAYDPAPLVWNAMYADRRPALIARPRTPADVAAIVDFAREGGWSPAVRGGGHNVTGYSICDDDLLIDLSLMRGVRVDPNSRTARVEGGALLADLDRNTQLYGLATPAGVVSHTGVAGLTLGGGHGKLTRKYGFTVDSLLGVDIVTADGRLRFANAANEPDLFWAVRGGGGNFGIITSFEFKAYPIGPLVWAETIGWPAAKTAEVLRFWREWVREQPPEVASSVAIAWPPPTLPGSSDSPAGALVLILVAWHGPLDEGESQFRAVREFQAPTLSTGGETTFVELQTLADEFACSPFGSRVYFKSGYINQLSDGAIDVIAKWAPTLPSAISYIEVNCIEGKANQVPPDATPLGARRAKFNHTIASAWFDAAQDSANIAWARNFYAEMEPHYDGGLYINYLDRGESQRLVQSAYSEDNWKRLREVKTRYDPGNLFRRNQNITPLEP